MSQSGVFERVPSVRFRVVEDQGLILRQDTSEVVVVNEVAARILQLLDGQRALREVAAILADEFAETPERLARDVETFVRELVDSGLVQVVSQDQEPGTGP